MVYIPWVRINLILVPILDRLGYSFLFGTSKVKLYRDSLLIGSGLLCGSLYILELSVLPSVFATLTVSNIKCLRLNEKSYILWHKHLGHIFKQRMKRLIKDEILPDLDLSNFDTYVDCIKGKLTAKIRNIKVGKCAELLGVIHIDICRSFTSLSMGGYKYFVTFIDDYSRYGFVKLICENSDSLEAFKAFKAKVKLQQVKKIKEVHSDRGGEYYSTYDETRHNPGPFEKYFQECDIDAQYTMSGTSNIMGLRRGEIAHFLKWCDVCLLIPHYLSSYGVKLQLIF